MMKVALLLFSFFIVNVLGSHALGQSIAFDSDNSVWRSAMWEAKWITAPNAPQRDYGVFNFRKSFDLSEKPSVFKIHMSADSRYRLFVNGIPVVSGPARGSLHQWYFESIDIAKYLKKGHNVIAVLVWNMGIYSPIAQITAQTALVIQGETEKEAVVNTDQTYKVSENKAYKPCSIDNMERLNAYMVIGPGDEVDAKLYPWNWQKNAFDDNKWEHALPLMRAVPQGIGTDNIWTLKPRNIPLMDEKMERLQKVVKVEGINPKSFDAFLQGNKPVRIPSNSKVKIWIDQTYNTIGYPEIVVSEGSNSIIKITYAEALFDKNGKKGNRNEIVGKQFIGNYDIFKPHGDAKIIFRPLWLRTYRYVELDIETRDKELVLEDFYGNYTAYPFEMNASVKTNDKTLDKLWEVSWRTARLCAGETYFDCPYYEQLQYPGDTRIQALISLYLSGDDRLMRKSLLDFHSSMVPEGMIQGRYPSSRLQIIPTYSLWWVSMLHDYWMHREDDVFLKEFLTGITNVLSWFEKRVDKDTRMLGPIDWWPFVDYTTGFKSGLPVSAKDGNSSVLTLQYAYTLNQAADLFAYFGYTEQALLYREQAKILNKQTYLLCFDNEKKIMADDPEKKVFSQHATILAVLSGALVGAEAKTSMFNVLNSTSTIPVTFYFRFYLNRALLECNMGDLYYAQLKHWRTMLDLGLTTFAETPEPARSDCHAWSASPSFDFLSIIAGIRTDAPGFKKVLIQPNFGELNTIEAKMPHPRGEIVVSLTKAQNDQVNGYITIPEGVEADFLWKSERQVLKSGDNQIKTPDSISILNDLGFKNGVVMRGTNTSAQIMDKFIFPYGKQKGECKWSVAEWGSKHKLSGRSIKNKNGEIVYANKGKRLGFLKTSTGIQTRMEVIAEHEYDKVREEGDYWPHLLLEQLFSPNQKIGDMQALLVKLNAKLLFSEIRMPRESLNRGLHSAQFQLFITVQDVRADSKGNGDFLWFGIPLYDFRYQEIPPYMAEDIGKDDASGKYIYMLASKDVVGGTLHDKQWHRVDYDILPDLRRAFEMAKKKGYLRYSNLEDLAVTSLNIGWENTATINSGVIIENLDIIKVVSHAGK